MNVPATQTIVGNLLSSYENESIEQYLRDVVLLYDVENIYGSRRTSEKSH